MRAELVCEWALQLILRIEVGERTRDADWSVDARIGDSLFTQAPQDVQICAVYLTVITGDTQEL